MGYQDSKQCKLLAVRCICCGAPLVDAVSVELGIGPDCRDGIFPDGVSDADRETANRLVHRAALAADNGIVEEVLSISVKLREMGWDVLSDRVAKRFRDGAEKAERNADIVIDIVDGAYVVKTPFRRSAKAEFISAWRKVPGRRYDRKTGVNIVPVESKAELWGLLAEFFPGKWGKGPKGVFRVPSPATVKVPAQMELELS